MNIFNISVPKDCISMIFDAFGNVENYSTTLYLHKSKITLAEEGNLYSAQLEIDFDQDTKKDKMVRQTLNKEYGSFILTFLNADFSNLCKQHGIKCIGVSKSFFRLQKSKFLAKMFSVNKET